MSSPKGLQHRRKSEYLAFHNSNGLYAWRRLISQFVHFKSSDQPTSFLLALLTSNRPSANPAYPT